jgi:hypothetical protein
MCLSVKNLEISGARKFPNRRHWALGTEGERLPHLAHHFSRSSQGPCLSFVSNLTFYPYPNICFKLDCKLPEYRNHLYLLACLFSFLSLLPQASQCVMDTHTHTHTHTHTQNVLCNGKWIPSSSLHTYSHWDVLWLTQYPRALQTRSISSTIALHWYKIVPIGNPT